jgi:hypothetical protein
MNTTTKGVTLQECKDKVAFKHFSVPYDKLLVLSSQLTVLEEAAELYASLLLSEREGKWISVKERLPEQLVHVMVHYGTMNPVRGYLDNNGKWNLYYFGGCELADNQNEITHWQPLPSPPKE